MTLRCAVVRFPGSNCDVDAATALRSMLSAEVTYVWHESTDLDEFDCIVLPGGFSYGDYLRSGAIARLSPVMQSIEAAAEAGTPILGICNGFQILTEAGLVPGALRSNIGLRFRCMHVELVVTGTSTPFTRGFDPGEHIVLPIAHAHGAYVPPPGELAALEATGQIVLRYVDNPNGSIGDIAAVSNVRGNVVGMMPHPERAVSEWLGSTDGRRVFESLLTATVEAAHA